MNHLNRLYPPFLQHCCEVTATLKSHTLHKETCLMDKLWILTEQQRMDVRYQAGKKGEKSGGGAGRVVECVTSRDTNPESS